MPKHGLDTIDCRIVAELQSDGRLSNVELADKVSPDDISQGLVS